jgi:GMP synthase (glutamine-hydrolysing)
MQLITHQLGGKVEKADHREYGLNRVHWEIPLDSVPNPQTVWMSHGDVVVEPPPGFKVTGRSDSQHIAAIGGSVELAKGAVSCWAVQFHPEVAHSQEGDKILKAFCEELCALKADWKAPAIAQILKDKMKSEVQDKVLCAISGGVDSSVVATLLTQSLGPDQVYCVFVNTGLLRYQEYETVMSSYKALGLNVKGVDASEEFYTALKGVSDPEKKRKIIGKLFIDIFEREVHHSQDLQNINFKYLAQGTLYPDVIESVSSVGGSVTIKSHHNVGGLPDKMKLKLVEPLRDLFKDEVRRVGEELGLPKPILWRHPFPGPGLAIRIMGEVTPEAVEIVRSCDHIFISKLREYGLYDKIWQAFCVLLPVQTVGVQGDSRTYEKVLALRAVTSSDGMTADWYPFTFEFLREVSNEITNKVKGVNRVVYDVTSKPPGTIEWE